MLNQREIVTSLYQKMKLEQITLSAMSMGIIKNFWEIPQYNDSEQALKSWYDAAKHANWQTPQDINQKYRNVSFVGSNRVVFNIHGNKYRLVVAINYRFSVCYIRFIGTHKQYDAVNVETI